MPGIGDLINAALGYRGPLDLLPREPGPRVTPEGALDAGSALAGAKVKPEQKSEFEQTLAPGEWEQMTPRERFDRLHMQLGQMAEGAAMMAGGGALPALGAHLPDARPPGSPRRGAMTQRPYTWDEVQALAPQLDPAMAKLAEGRFVDPEQVRLNRNRYLAAAGEPDAKIVKRGGQPLEYAKGPAAGPAVRLEREGKPFFIGELTPEQWLEKTQAWVGERGSPEWEKGRDWYPNLLGEFTKVYGEELAPAMLSLWGLSQQRASPSRGMADVLKAQDIIGGWRDASEGNAGLAHERLMKALQTGQADVGEKLADFADAVRGRDTRQWTGDDPRTGQPAPFDVHASRDVGFIDETQLAKIAKHFGPEVAARFAIDAKGAPSDAQYAWGSRFYNQLKDWMNSQLQPGERPYTAKDVQALGWVGHQKMVGDTPEHPQAIFQGDAGGRTYANTARVAVEAAPGEGSPRLALWEKIPEERRAEATYRALQDTAPDVARAVGVTLARREPTVGGWEQYTNPNTTFEVVGTPEGAERFAKAMAFVHHQSEAWAHRTSIKDRANAWAMDIAAPQGYDLSKPSEVTRFWNESGLAQVPGLGFSKVDLADGPRVRVIFQRDLANLSDAARGDGRDFADLAGPAIRQLDQSPVEGIRYSARPLDLRRAVHDWKEDASGEGHIRGFQGGTRGELDRLSRRAEESLRAFVPGAGEGQAGAEGQAAAPQEVRTRRPRRSMTIGDLARERLAP